MLEYTVIFHSENVVMPRDVMLHIDERLDADAQRRLIAPVVFFHSPRTRPATVRELGYHTEIIDL